MVKKAKGQVMVDVTADLSWRGLTKDIVATVPKILLNLVEEGQILEGDGGLGSMILSNGSGEVMYQKEKIEELDESRLRLGLRVTEGGHLVAGFSFYGVTFQLTPAFDNEIIVDVMIVLECDSEETDSAFLSK